jgi:hypothetical protein
MNFINYIKKYWPDILILSGILLLSYHFFQCEEVIRSIALGDKVTIVIEWWKIGGVMMICVGLDILIRRLKK